MAGRRTSDADTDSAGLERRTFTGEPEETGKDTTEEQPSGFLRPDWKEFPTQSPVCSRDDGISTGLDGIAFSKWRQESIKAYGNAILPQVIYEIFRAINIVENGRMENY